MKRLELSFYQRNSVLLAQKLLGKYLIRNIGGDRIMTKIVETEAYMGPEDKAAHSYNNRRTQRTEVMFGRPGKAYVYMIYGMYYCLNIVAGEEEIPEAVLIRAVSYTHLDWVPAFPPVSMSMGIKAASTTTDSNTVSK